MRGRRTAVNTYIIRRRSAWITVTELERAAGRSSRVGDQEMPERVRWIRSYIVEERDGSLGSVSVYQAVDVEALREHATRAGLPCDEVIRIRTTAIVRPDPILDSSAA